MSKETEKFRSNEKLKWGTDATIALQARLLLGGDLLNPKNPTKEPINPLSGLGELGHRSYAPFERTSQLERRIAWQDEKTGGLETRLDIWSRNLVTAVKTKKTQLGQSEADRWQKIFGKLDLGLDINDFNQVKAKQFYNQVFKDGPKGNQGREIKDFVVNVVSKYQSKPKDDEESSFNYDQLQKDLPAYLWLAKIFGKGSSIVITELIVAEARLLEKKRERQRFINELNTRALQTPLINMGLGNRRIDRIKPQEKEVLDFVTGALQNQELSFPSILGDKKLVPRPTKEEEIGMTAPVATGVRRDDQPENEAIRHFIERLSADFEKTDSAEIFMDEWAEILKSLRLPGEFVITDPKSTIPLYREYLLAIKSKLSDRKGHSTAYLNLEFEDKNGTEGLVLASRSGVWWNSTPVETSVRQEAENYFANLKSEAIDHINSMLYRHNVQKRIFNIGLSGRRLILVSKDPS